MQNSIHQFFSRVLADGNVGARKELASVIQHILVTRLRSLGILNLLEVDIRLISYVLVLMADESEEVQTCSRLVRQSDSIAALLDFKFALHVELSLDYDCMDGKCRSQQREAE